jgi:PTH2 family peptidyl-tRNA hydrolase
MKTTQNTKQVIVMRKDLNMRKGKIAAQAGHACMAFITKNIISWLVRFLLGREQESAHWLQHSFRKICVSVDSEEELEAIHQKALDKGLISHMITDNGTTEFNGVPTKTCLAIGPHWDEKFDGVTDKLPLL